MLDLTLAIASSAMISILMRLSKSRVQSNMFMFMANYLACAVLSALFGVGQTVLWPQAQTAVSLGLISGVMYLAAFMLLQLNIRRNGVVLSATFMKLGVLVPTLMAVLIYHEQPSPACALGFLIALAAIVIINSGGPAHSGTASGLLLLVLLLTGGLTDSLANIFEKSSPAGMKDFYLLITFATAALLSLLFALKKHQQLTRGDLLWGVVIGIPNYFSSRFMLLALAQLPAVVVYPVFNMAVVMIVTLAGTFFFRQTLRKRQLLALALIVSALVLLNL